MDASTQLTHADPRELGDDAVALVRKWLQAQASDEVPLNAAAKRLSMVLEDSNGLDFTVGFVDRVIRTEDVHAAAAALHELGEIVPATLPALDKAQIRMGAALAPRLPHLVIPVARRRLRAMVGHMVVDARDKQLGAAIAKLRADGTRLNINLLGEAVLGDAEADHHLAETARLLDRPDVDYVSIKASSVAAQLSLWDFNATADRLIERLSPLYRSAAAAPAGTKFINLDMEEYRDLDLTIEVFTRLLDQPELQQLEAGIVLQAYLPDALSAIQRLTAWADRRVSADGSGIKVRLVKGANLAMEKVDAQIHGWPLTVCCSKQETDTNYKRVLNWILRPEHTRAVRMGVAGHNLFDIAFAHLLADRRGVSDRVEFEMLQGMATGQAAAVRKDVGDMLLYVPAVHPREFDVAISYLVRRLEENSATENFMSGIFELRDGNNIFDREAARFLSSLKELDDGVPSPNRTQNRLAEQNEGSLEAGFVNEPDTDPALVANREWAYGVIDQVADSGFLASLPTPAPLGSDEVDTVIARGRKAAEGWAARPARERAELLYRVADALADRRGELIAVMAAEAGKTIAQADPEVSEAIDFARYYAQRALELDSIEGASFHPVRMTLVTPPWNFPIAIPAGSTLAPLATGSAVIHKPAPQTVRCSTALIEVMWQAGIPRDVLQLVEPVEGEIGQKLVSHEGVDQLILTGAFETASLFHGWRPELELHAETSGKNALLVTPSADRDLAVADLVNSAFGHAGQKCSAASLAICVGSVYDSERFRRQLVDAASTMVVGWPTDPASVIGPVIEPPTGKLRRALTTLDPGESWLLEPRQLDETGRLWSPGIKDGVAPGSFFHLNECFGPVLGLMRAKDLDQGLALQNAPDYGLTAGIHSLDAAEVTQWIDEMQAGNLYVNRSITGAIVRRQSFGGWKRSAIGVGAKAGGPNYLTQLGQWSPAEVPGQQQLPTGPRVASAIATLSPVVSDPDRLEAAARSDEYWWAEEFGQARDASQVGAEANIFRYRPSSLTVRVADDASIDEVARVVIAGIRSGGRISLNSAIALPEALTRLVAETTYYTDDEFRTTLAKGRLSGRVRIVGSAAGLAEATAEHPDIALIDHPVLPTGRIELQYLLREQAVSITTHRFGNPAPALAAVLPATAS
ncbi:proline dehydrogenase family protein [Saxibacter everestensis]|uniref:L-glutamate gamma-semialdehyde dehydrogenase n=1 Tax=Saxibacter everestensis TaxID=2909229 RepID=A0ABY8QPK0_9MICO|nr:proline dehydrogenase family protein [Brevibacteriaceae bacterium ZFBP1038]